MSGVGRATLNPAPLPPERKHPMTEVFSVGDMVTYTGAFSQKPIECKIVRVMPRDHAHTMRSYRVRGSTEAFDRAVPEFALSLMTISPSDTAFKR
jgi:hypothetical protein